MMSIVFFAFSFLSCVVLFLLLLNERRKYKSLTATRNKSIMEDLDLATSDQLFDELRKRSGLPYLIVSPFGNEDYDGIKIEIHNIPALSAVKMLGLGLKLINKQVEKHGIESFENSINDDDDDDEGEKWKGQ